jgi:hypothetical protein
MWNSPIPVVQLIQIKSAAFLVKRNWPPMSIVDNLFANVEGGFGELELPSVLVISCGPSNSDRKMKWASTTPMTPIAKIYIEN